MFKKISLSVMLCLPALALADFNPYTVFNSDTSSNQQSSNTSSTTQSNYLQPGPLAAPATAPKSASTTRNQSTSTAPTVNGLPYPMPTYPRTTVPGASSSSNSTSPSTASNTPNGANVIVPIPSPSGPITPIVPTGGSGGGGQSLLEQINQGVQTINSNMITWKAQEASAQTAAGAQLNPSTSNALSDFLANQSGYQSISSLPSLTSSFSLTSQLQPYASPIPSSSSSSSASAINAKNFAMAQAAFSNNNFQTAFMLYPTTVADMQALSVLTGNDASSMAQNYSDGFLGALPVQAGTLRMNYQNGIFSLVNFDFSQIASQTKPVGTMDSQMSMLQNAVNAPFSPTPDQASGQTWFQQLSTASTPQLLRSVAILIATQNQMQYTALQNLQTLNAMQGGQLAELAAIDQKMQQMINNQQQTNNLLQKMIDTLVAQGNKN